jgi:cytoskeletal protein CcmA (bactofilin family)
MGGNLIAFSERIRINGKVRGDTLIHARDITLNGEFFGDVNINPSSSVVSDSEEDTRVFISPETIIHGKLTYTGLKQAQVSQGAKISNYEWIKSTIVEKTNEKASNYIYKFIKLLFTTVIYYLIAMLLYKLFPDVFRKHGEIISEKPMKVFVTGLISLASTVIAFFVFIILLVMSFVISPVIGLVFGSAVLLIYILLFFFSTVPVSLWLGNKIFKDKYNLPYRFAGGLSLITFGVFAINLLSKMPSLGFVFGMLSFFIGFATLTFGTGALLYVRKGIYLPTDKVDNV